MMKVLDHIGQINQKIDSKPIFDLSSRILAPLKEDQETKEIRVKVQFTDENSQQCIQIENCEI